MPKKSGFKPGQTAPNSGQYQQIGPRGGKGREVTVVKGEPLPPTTMPGSSANYFWFLGWVESKIRSGHSLERSGCKLLRKVTSVKVEWRISLLIQIYS